jgi:hypothetical protein
MSSYVVRLLDLKELMETTLSTWLGDHVALFFIARNHSAHNVT